jgi:hypothetical protein
MGIALLPRSVLQIYAERDRLSVHKLRSPFGHAKTHLVWRKEAPQAKVLALSSVLLEQVQLALRSPKRNPSEAEWPTTQPGTQAFRCPLPQRYWNQAGIGPGPNGRLLMRFGSSRSSAYMGAAKLVPTSRVTVPLRFPPASRPSSTGLSSVG